MRGATTEAAGGVKIDLELGRRISEVVKLFPNAGAAAEAAGFSLESLDRYRKLETGLKLEPLIRLTRAAGVSLHWLATGDGSMLLVPDGGDPSGDDLVALPRYEIQAAAGDGMFVQAELVAEWIYFRRAGLRRELGVNPNCLSIISATGDSMAPTIEEGDLLLVDVNDQRWSRDGIYVLGHEYGLVVKRVARRGGGEIVVSSDNPRYTHTTEELRGGGLSDLRFVGRVVWVGGRI